MIGLFVVMTSNGVHPTQFPYHQPGIIMNDHLKVIIDPEHNDNRLKVEDSDATAGSDFKYQLPMWSDAGASWGTLSVSPPAPEHRTIFFDLDNTLYSKSLGIHLQMADRIQLFMRDVLLLPKEESRRLSAKYYLDYGLSVRGILNDFQIETSEYDRFVDGGLQLEGLIKPSDELRSWVESIQGSRWIFTNAGLGHAERVLKLLNIRDLFEGVIYCDYGENQFPAKPERLAYERAMKWAGVRNPEHCYFIDDSANNVRVASELGWKAALFDEDNDLLMSIGTSEEHKAQEQQFHRIRNLYDFTNVFPELLRPEEQPKPSKSMLSIAQNDTVSCHSI